MLPRNSEHSRRIIEANATAGYDNLLAYCTVCTWYQRGDLATVMSEWALHLAEVSAVATP